MEESSLQPAPIRSHEPPERLSETALLLDRAFTRAAGAELIPGNDVRLLRDGAENYPAWLEAIGSARERIFFENYFICEDEVGAQFADALISRARAGVRVRLIYDWLGAFRKSSRRFWRALTDGGVEVRCFNPPRFLTPLELLHRDHRKMIAVDGHIAFITGMCVGRMWLADGAQGREAWRDTGIQVRGPAVSAIERAFAQVWAAIGTPLPPEELTPSQSIAPAGDVAMRIVANAPGTTGIFRLDQLVAAAAQRTLWIADAYFAGVPSYVQALRAAAMDGVDVRLLVPGASDVPLVRPLTYAGYRPLLETGVRVFEWKGPMMHAKSAVADGRWARVGSSNLNVASWINNYELDAVIENESFARQMEEMYLADLAHATEIVLKPRRRGILLMYPLSGRRDARQARAGASGAAGSASRAAAGALRLGRTVGAALTEQRVLAPTEARPLAYAGVLALIAAGLAIFWPRLAAVPVALLLLWIGVALLARARALRKARRARGLPPTRLTPADRA